MKSQSHITESYAFADINCRLRAKIGEEYSFFDSEEELRKLLKEEDDDDENDENSDGSKNAEDEDE